ncbi:MMPL family transporter [Azospirillum melinis]|uniref:MMPL family transporter n=1 Tax=Azospirillum melinis TaxID=328839 RepID=A0ABX2KVF7_9PROT|nr:MMPL family transporter [Azospirillum melinis]MBP2306700.1 putative exporter [Azospirillum melinis]NUB03879.1 MMPL family transporter [Azospirillum melinis]
MTAAARRGGWSIALWLAGLIVCGLLVARTSVTADLSAFLPRSPSATQQLLVDQLRDGVVSRLILVAIEGDAPDRLTGLSRALAARLRGNPLVAAVENGERTGRSADGAYLWTNRYLLSPGVTPDRFTVEGLHAALQNDLRLLQSPAGMALKQALPADPTAEILRLTDRMLGDTAGPASRDGVWVSADGARALLLVQTAAPGFDMDAQQKTLDLIRGAFDEAHGTAGPARLVMTGPAVFSVQTRDRIEADATRSSIVATVLVAGILLLVYRSLRVLALSLLPAATGTLAGIAAVGLGFGTVHGITLGFGVTLLGESVDYAIYLFTQTQPGSPAHRTLRRIWPTVLLGMATSVVGFGTMLFSSFSGLAQLGLFSITGLVVALAVTRWVLPSLLPDGYATERPARLAPVLTALTRGAPTLRLPLAAATLLSLAWLAYQGSAIWSAELSSLSPVTEADQRLDEALRRDLGAPDAGHLLVTGAATVEEALAAVERLAVPLEALTRDRLIAGYESPAHTLPSQAAQRARQAALPPPDRLRASLTEALQGLPFRPDAFAPFLADAEKARTMPLLTPASLDGTSLKLKFESLLVRSGTGWTAMLPLRGVTDPRALAARLSGDPAAQGATLLNLKEESDSLYRTYRQEALTLALLGAAAITLLLALALRSVRSLIAAVMPLAAAVVITMALVTALGQTLTIFHLVGLLLVVGVGSNYSLLFERPEPSSALRERTVASVAIANLCTVIGFGTLAFSSIPVLHGIGMTVAIGAFLCLAFAAVLDRQQPAEPEGASHG